MTSIPALRRAVVWARSVLGDRHAKYGNVRIFPWSSTVRLTSAEGSFWVKVGAAHNYGLEAGILESAALHGISSVPRLIASNAGLRTLLLEHVPSSSRPLVMQDVEEQKRGVCAELAAKAGNLCLTELTAISCAEEILHACGRTSLWCMERGTARRLVDSIRESQPIFTQLDATLSVSSGKAEMIHGDFHPGNIMSGPDGPVFLDWAEAVRGSPEWDRSILAASVAMESGSNVPGPAVLLSGLKMVRDFVLTPAPDKRDTSYSLPVENLRQNISARAEGLCRSFTIVRNQRLEL